MSFFFVFLLFQSSFCLAEVVLPVSCDNVTKITIDQAKLAEKEAIIEGTPYLYSIAFWLLSTTAKKYSRIADPAIVETINPDGTRTSHKPLHLLTPEGIVAGDSPYQECVNSRQILLSFKSKAGAFEAAQKVCPQLEPKTYFVHDYLEKQRLKNEKQD